MMRGFTFIILALVVMASLVGCGKKQESLEQMQEPMSMETLSMISNETPTSPAQAQAPQAPAADTKLEFLPPSGPYKPTTIEIQTALKNAGYYTGTVDGKLGSLTKKAVEEFQKANSLKADGKVGPQTWSALSKHLDSSIKAKKKKR